MIRTIEANRLYHDFRLLRDEVRVVARGDEKFLLCCGPPGCGKTVTVERAVREAEVPFRHAAPASPRGAIEVLRSTRRGVVLFDDKDFLLRRLEIVSILKILTDPLDDRVIPYDLARGFPPFRPRCGLIINSNSDLTDPKLFPLDIRPHIDALLSRGSVFRLSFDPIDGYDYSVWLALECDLLRPFGLKAANLALEYFAHHAARLRERSPRCLSSIARWAFRSPGIWRQHFDRQLVAPIDFPVVRPDQIRPRSPKANPRSQKMALLPHLDAQPKRAERGSARPDASRSDGSGDGDNDPDPPTGGGAPSTKLGGNGSPVAPGVREIQLLASARGREALASRSNEPDGGTGVKGCTYIYAPAGRAGEYAALASNPYRGCGHSCLYCYVPRVVHMPRHEFDAGAVLRENFIERLRHDARKYQAAGITDQVMLSFTTDPYHHFDTTPTRQTLEILIEHGLGFCTLTKGGLRALRDLDLFRPDRDAFASTLTSLDPDFGLKWERAAALPADRIAALKRFHERGIFTWVSLEPTLSPEYSLAVVQATHQFVDLFKVGKANYLKNLTKEIDWRDYTLWMIDLLGSLGKAHYVKKDLQEFLPAGYHNPLRVPQHH